MVSTTTSISGIALSSAAHPRLDCPAMPSAAVTFAPAGLSAAYAQKTARNTDVEGFPPRGPAPA